MSFQTRYFYAIIIGLPVVKPKYNIIRCVLNWVVSDAKRQKAEWITQKVMYLSLLNYGSNHLTLRDLRGRSFQIYVINLTVEKNRKSIIAKSY